MRLCSVDFLNFSKNLQSSANLSKNSHKGREFYVEFTQKFYNLAKKIHKKMRIFKKIAKNS